MSHDVEAKLAILDLEGEYGRTWDTVDGDGWANLFTPDGTVEIVAHGKRPHQTFTGTHELAELCRKSNRYLAGLHLVHTPALRIDGDRAYGWIHFEFRAQQTRRDGTRAPFFVAGVYTVTYVKTAAGWRMQRRTEYPVIDQDGDFHGIPKIDWPPVG